MNTNLILFKNDLVYFPIRATANFLHQFEIILWISVQYICSCMSGTHFAIVSSFTSVPMLFLSEEMSILVSVGPMFHFTIDFL